MLCSESRAEVDADRFLAISDASLRRSVLSHLRDDLLAPGNGRGLTLVVTDWWGCMPSDVQSLLGEFIEAQGGEGTGLRLTSLDLHGRVGWFVELLQSRRAEFESPQSWLQSLELSLDGVSYLSSLPRFGNLRVLRVYHPEFGSDGAEMCTVLLRHNLSHLREFACVSSEKTAPLVAALRELDTAVVAEGAPPTLSALAATHIVDAGATATTIDVLGYPPMAVTAVERAHRGARERETALWLRAPEAAMTEALELLGEAIARSNALPESARPFLGRLRSLRLDLSTVPSGGLDAYRAHAAFKLRDERLGSDAKLGLRLRVEARHPTNAGRDEETVLMCLFVTVLTVSIESARGLCLPVVPRNSTVPTRRVVRLRWDEGEGAFVPGGTMAAAAAIAPTGAAAAAAAEAAGSSAGGTRQTLRVLMGERAMSADNEAVGEVEVVVDAGGEAELVFDFDANEVFRVHGVRLEAFERLNAAMVQQHIEAGGANRQADREHRRALLEEMGVTEEAFLSAATMYRAGGAEPIVAPPRADETLTEGAPVTIEELE